MFRNVVFLLLRVLVLLAPLSFRVCNQVRRNQQSKPDDGASSLQLLSFFPYNVTILQNKIFTVHSVWKSQKKSHWTLRAKRATFTFWVDKKLIKNVINGPFRNFEATTKKCYKTGTFFKIGQKLLENAQTKKLKCDNLGDFQTLSFGLADFPNVDIVWINASGIADWPGPINQDFIWFPPLRLSNSGLGTTVPWSVVSLTSSLDFIVEKYCQDQNDLQTFHDNGPSDDCYLFFWIWRFL